jgi:hsp70-interacting protein
MNDPNLNQILKWSVENSSASQTAEDAPKTQLDPQAVAILLGLSGNNKSDGDRMKEAIAVAKNKEATLENRLIAFDNFEQLIEHLDNANYMEGAELWMPLAKLLEDEHAEIRRYAAWCCGTAVQNNVRTQERVSSYLIADGYEASLTLYSFSLWA